MGWAYGNSGLLVFFLRFFVMGWISFINFELVCSQFKNMYNKKSILKDNSFQFALRIISLYKVLSNEQKEYVMSKQLLRSATSVGANIREAQNAQSNADFIHKLYISQKECDESIYWLELLFHSNYINKTSFEELEVTASKILKMLKSSILTMKQKHNL